MEFRVGDGLLVVLKRQDRANIESPTHVPWIFVDDLDAHYAMTTAGGVRVIEDIHHYGYQAYTVEGPEGHHWTVAQNLPSTPDPSDKGLAIAKVPSSS
ncbi:MAG TPA: hypothetical protein VE569_09105 [Acidimicrobiia bacterium]|nr:hypothetical protein [Acidimicrobiia bacterium]